MTEKRFYVDKSPITHLYVPYDKEQEFVFEGVENKSTIMKLVELLNNTLEKNEQLKSEWGKLNILYKAKRNSNKKVLWND